MTNGDRQHFESYREQTQLKHRILAKYLKAFLHILKQNNKNLVYIDGFAGRGTYTDGDQSQPGSPLLALQLLAGHPELAKRTTTLFVEKDRDNFQQLEAEVSSFCKQHPVLRTPHLLLGEFAEQIKAVVASVESLAPTFLFVDPCGIKGASFEAINLVLQHEKTEAFIFFNLDGVRRVAGLSEVSDSLVELFGSKERAARLIQAMRGRTPEEREQLVVQHYREAFTQVAGARYVVAFRVESAARRTTSHYFIHVSKHQMAFRIMKDVMWALGETADGAGGLEKIQASCGEARSLFGGTWEEFKAETRRRIGSSRSACETIYFEWVEDPSDMHCTPEYRKVLLELEAEGRIQVLDKYGAPMPADSRRKIRGKSTLGEQCSVQCCR
ncbi:MAG: three-Cys-motif partner protein TcmP [Rhodoferax sp.]